MATNPTLTVTPSSPVAGDGILFVVTGPVGGKFPDATTKMIGTSTGRIEVKDENDRVRATSPVFAQEDKYARQSEVVEIEGDGTSGYFTISAVVRQPYNPGYPEGAAGLGVDLDLPETGHIVYDASDDDISAALVAAWGTDVVEVSGGPIGSEIVTLDFGSGKYRYDKVTVTVNDNTSGGTTTASEANEGGTDALVDGGPYSWGPIQLPPGVPSGDADYTADVVYVDVAEADSSGVAGDSMLSRPVSFTVTAS